MNFKQSIVLICIFSMLWETLCVEKLNLIKNKNDTNANNTTNKKKLGKKHMRNKNGKGKSKMDNSDLEQIVIVKSPNDSTENSSDINLSDIASVITELGSLFMEPLQETILSKYTNGNNKGKKHSAHHNKKEDDKTYVIETNEDQSEENSKLEDDDLLNFDDATLNIEQDKNKNKHSHMKKKNKNKGNDDNTISINEDIIDELINLFMDNSDNNEKKGTKTNALPTNINKLSELMKENKNKSSEVDEDIEDLNERILIREDGGDYDENEDILDDIEPKITKKTYYPLGEHKEQFIEKINETTETSENNENSSSASIENADTTTQNNEISEESKLSNPVETKSISENSEDISKTNNMVSFIQKDIHKVQNYSNNNNDDYEDENKDSDENEENDEDEKEDEKDEKEDHKEDEKEENNSDKDNSGEEDSNNTDETNNEDYINEEDVVSESEDLIKDINDAKIKEDADLSSYDMEEDTNKNNESNNTDDISLLTSKKLIRNASKVFNLNLFNCNFITDWDFTKEYIDEQGSLVKLSGYVFQNMLNSNSMPTSNLTEWKLKGACSYEKYLCGALIYMDNVYEKGDRILFDGKIYEALNDTAKSPKLDDESWVDKTMECSK